MINTKLILVEGLPGSGKTTSAQLINDYLKESNIDTKLFLEGDFNHPADYESTSFFSKAEFQLLLQQYPELKHILLKYAVERCDGYVLSQYKLKEVLGETTVLESFWEKIWTNDIYELPLEKNIELITDKWRRFVEEANASEQTFIFECCFIQNPVTIGMIKFGTSQDVVMSYVRQLAESIAPLNPILIYVDQQDVSQSFRKAVQERPKEWSTGFMEYYNGQGYGKMVGADGLEGTIAVLKARNQVESFIYDKLDMVKFKLDNSHFDLNLHKSRLTEYFILN